MLPVMPDPRQNFVIPPPPPPASPGTLARSRKLYQDSKHSFPPPPPAAPTHTQSCPELPTAHELGISVDGTIDPAYDDDLDARSQPIIAGSSAPTAADMTATDMVMNLTRERCEELQLPWDLIWTLQQRIQEEEVALMHNSQHLVDSLSSKAVGCSSDPASGDGVESDVSDATGGARRVNGQGHCQIDASLASLMTWAESLKSMEVFDAASGPATRRAAPDLPLANVALAPAPAAVAAAPDVKLVSPSAVVGRAAPTAAADVSGDCTAASEADVAAAVAAAASANGDDAKNVYVVNKDFEEENVKYYDGAAVEMSVRVGEVVRVEQFDAEWWYCCKLDRRGRCTDQRGWVPECFLSMPSDYASAIRTKLRDKIKKRAQLRRGLAL